MGSAYSKNGQRAEHTTKKRFRTFSLGRHLADLICTAARDGLTEDPAK